MRQAFQDELNDVNDQLVQMCQRTSTQITDATTALLQVDLAIAERVLESDAEIDHAQLEIDERVLQLMALQAPVATELRVVLSAMRHTADIARMGDLAVHVAKIARMRYPEHTVPESLRETFAAMGRSAASIGVKASEVIRTRDLAKASQLDEDDDEMDRLHRSLFTTMFDKTDASPDSRTIETAVDVALLGRYYERFADHAVEVASNVQYLVTGTSA